jgi:hypothetical protein
MKSKLLLFVFFLVATIGVVNSQVVDPNLVKTYMKFDGNLDDASNNPVTYTVLMSDICVMLVLKIVSVSIPSDFSVIICFSSKSQI